MVAGAGGGCDIIPKRKFTSPIVCQVCIFLNFVKYDFQDLVKTKKAGQMIPKVFGRSEDYRPQHHPFTSHQIIWVTTGIHY